MKTVLCGVCDHPCPKACATRDQHMTAGPSREAILTLLTLFYACDICNMAKYVCHARLPTPLIYDTSGHPLYEAKGHETPRFVRANVPDSVWDARLTKHAAVGKQKNRLLVPPVAPKDNINTRVDYHAHIPPPPPLPLPPFFSHALCPLTHCNEIMHACRSCLRRMHASCRCRFERPQGRASANAYSVAIAELLHMHAVHFGDDSGASALLEAASLAVHARVEVSGPLDSMPALCLHDGRSLEEPHWDHSLHMNAACEFF